MIYSTFVSFFCAGADYLRQSGSTVRVFKGGGGGDWKRKKKRRGANMHILNVGVGDTHII